MSNHDGPHGPYSSVDGANPANPAGPADHVDPSGYGSAMVPGAPEPGQQGPGKTVIWTIAAVVAALGVAIAVLGVYVVDSSENSVGPVSSLFSDDDDSGSDSGTGAYGDVSAEVSYAGGVVTLQGEDTAADAPVVDIFLDFSCPYCADLAASSHEDLSDALAEGSVVVQLHVLNFLDGDSDGRFDPQDVGSSTRAGSAAIAVAETGNAEAFLALHDKALLERSTVAQQWDFADFADLAEEHGVDADTVEAIRSGEVIDEGNAAFAVNFGVLEERAGEVATPSVFVTSADGGEPAEVEMLLDPSTGKIASWVPLVMEDGTAA